MEEFLLGTLQQDDRRANVVHFVAGTVTIDGVLELRETLLDRTNVPPHREQLIDVLSVVFGQFLPPRLAHLGREPVDDVDRVVSHARFPLIAAALRGGTPTTSTLRFPNTQPHAGAAFI
jgi:hypothetical protein